MLVYDDTHISKVLRTYERGVAALPTATESGANVGPQKYQGVHETEVPEAVGSWGRLIAISMARGILPQLLAHRSDCSAGRCRPSS